MNTRTPPIGGPPVRLEEVMLAELAGLLDPLAGGDSPFAEEVAACKGLAEFVRRAWPAIEPGTVYLANWHIDCICEHLEAVTAGQITRLLINIPPRYMKSITCSVMWPLWEWTFRPEVRYMFATYSSALSNNHADQRRAILRSEWYRDRWPGVRVIKDDVMTVRNSRRGVMEATSFSGTATGLGANRLVADDPHNPKQAESDVERVQTVTDFNRTFSNRLNDKKRDAILVVMQRLHQDDVAARCLELGYKHLCLPAESEGRAVVTFPVSGREVVREDGDLLWPEREGPAEIEGAKRAMGSYAFAGQYQQRPAPEGGGMFRDFIPCKAAPERAKRVRYWDKAGTAGGGAYTAGVKMALTDDKRYIIEHVVRGQWSAGERERIIKETAAADGRECHVWVEQEPGSGGKESAENTVKNLAGFLCHIERVTGDKESRARPLAVQTEVGNVYMVEGPWNLAFVDEARDFPVGRYKDQIDAAGGAFNKLALCPRPGATSAAPGVAPVPVPAAVRGPGLTIPDVMSGRGW